MWGRQLFLLQPSSLAQQSPAENGKPLLEHSGHVPFAKDPTTKEDGFKLPALAGATQRCQQSKVLQRKPGKSGAQELLQRNQAAS